MITKKTIKQKADLTDNQYQYMKQNNPKRLELITKGIIFEMIENNELIKEICAKSVIDLGVSDE